ncbi:hypothetical protein BC835DRAFT_1417480 [Cytidiella melzeri]|nr:hypothetical protein BC835DRAFT_1417480 [Cytidiella melzeri]
MRPSIAVALALLATVGPALSSPVASPVVSLDEPSANPTVAGNDVDNNTVTQLAMIGARAPGMDSSQTPRRRAEPTELEGLLARISEEQDLADLQRDMKELQKILETRVQNLGSAGQKTFEEVLEKKSPDLAAKWRAANSQHTGNPSQASGSSQ